MMIATIGLLVMLVLKSLSTSSAASKLSKVSIRMQELSPVNNVINKNDILDFKAEIHQAQITLKVLSEKPHLI